jgi:hypothetical protein
LLDGCEAPFERDAFAVVGHLDAGRERTVDGGVICILVSRGFDIVYEDRSSPDGIVEMSCVRLMGNGKPDCAFSEGGGKPGGPMVLSNWS